MSETSGLWQNTISPRDQDEEYEGEGDLLPTNIDSVPVDTKHWRIQQTTGTVKPKWRNCHTAVLQNDSKMIVRYSYWSSISLVLALDRMANFDFFILALWRHA